MLKLKPYNLILWIVGIVGIFCLAYWIKQIIMYVPISQEMDFGEPEVFGNIVRWANLDFRVNQMYTPMYYIVVAPLYKIFGFGFWEGRLISVIATVGCLVCVYLIIKSLTNNWKISFVLALLPLTHPIIRNWSLMCRVDMLAICFELIGIYLFVRFSKNSINKKVLWCVPFLVLAFFTKQTTLVGSGVIMLWLLLKDWKLGLYFIYLMVVAVLTLGYGLVNLTIGQDWSNNMQNYQVGTAYLAIDTDSFKMVKLCGATYLPMAILFCLSVLYGWHHRYFKKWDIFVIYFVASVVFNIFMLLLIGGSYGRDVQVIFATSLVAGLFIYSLKDKVLNLKVVMVFVAIFILEVATFIAVPAVVALPDKGYVQRCDEVTEIISDAELPILSENGGLVINANKVSYGNPYGLTFSKVSGYSNPDSLSNDLKAKKISYVITTKELPNIEELQSYDIETQQVILENYHLVYSKGMPEYPSWYALVVYEANEVK